jgi:hypothetical protein
MTDRALPPQLLAHHREFSAVMRAYMEAQSAAMRHYLAKDERLEACRMWSEARRRAAEEAGR